MPSRARASPESFPLFELEATWRGRAPAEIHRLRAVHMRPQADAFFAWAALEHDKVRHQRGLLRSALGYAVRQKDALMRVFDDGRLLLDNNRSERALRGTVATGRKAWLFVGSDDHGQSAAHLFSLVSSCRLHGLDPEAYLRDLFRVLAAWPKHRQLELAPKYWAATRARLDPGELALEFGPLAVPPTLDPSARFVLVAATPQMRSLQGKAVEVERDAQVRVLKWRAPGRDLGR